MIRLLPVQIAVVLFTSVCTLVGEIQSNTTATVSITISNQSDVVLTLRINEAMFLPSPPRPVDLSPSQHQIPYRPLRAMNTNRFRAAQAVKSGGSVTIEIPPGDYQLFISGSPQRSTPPTSPPEQPLPRPRLAAPLHGFLSISNAETWIFKINSSSNFQASVSANGPDVPARVYRIDRPSWNMEIPSRPGFRLSALPESPKPSRPQRDQPLDTAAPARVPTPEMKAPQFPPVTVPRRSFLTNSPK